jgi:hypothetical protein
MMAVMSHGTPVISSKASAPAETCPGQMYTNMATTKKNHIKGLAMRAAPKKMLSPVAIA